MHACARARARLTETMPMTPRGKHGPNGQPTRNHHRRRYFLHRRAAPNRSLDEGNPGTQMVARRGGRQSWTRKMRLNNGANHTMPVWAGRAVPGGFTSEAPPTAHEVQGSGTKRDFCRFHGGQPHLSPTTCLCLGWGRLLNKQFPNSKLLCMPRIHSIHVSSATAKVSRSQLVGGRRGRPHIAVMYIVCTCASTGKRFLLFPPRGKRSSRVGFWLTVHACMLVRMSRQQVPPITPNANYPRCGCPTAPSPTPCIGCCRRGPRPLPMPRAPQRPRAELQAGPRARTVGKRTSVANSDSWRCMGPPQKLVLTLA